MEDGKIKLSEDCNYILSQMLKEKWEERPSIKDILNYNRFKEIKDLKEDKNKNVMIILEK